MVRSKLGSLLTVLVARSTVGFNGLVGLVHKGIVSNHRSIGLQNFGFAFEPRRRTRRRSGSTSRFSSGSTEQTNDAVRHLEGIKEVLFRSGKGVRRLFLLDMWGVMHNGSRPYEGVLDTIARLKAEGARLVILSNSSKRRDKAVRMLKKLGFDPEDFEQIITSGEVSYQMLSGDPSLNCQNWPVLTELLNSSRKRVFVFGSGDGDVEYCESAGWTLAPRVEEADLVLARGTFTVVGADGVLASKKDDGDEAYFATHDDVLRAAAALRIPMLVSNPDKVRPDEGLPPMPGAIGDAYERLLDGVVDDPRTLVKRIGKPFPEVYELALDGTTSSSATTRPCMVGDALATDVLGGSRADCDTVWVIEDGIHAEAARENGVESVLDAYHESERGGEGPRLVPDMIVAHFRW